MRITKDLDKVVDKYLKIWYSVLNRELFDNKLPKKIPIGSARVRGLKGFTDFRISAETGKYSKVYCLCVDPRDYNPLEVLLHEMVHVWQCKVLQYKYPHKPMHDHVFWQKFRLAKRQLQDKINELQVEL